MLNLLEGLRRRRQSGEGKIGAIIALVVIVFVVIVLIKYVPVRVRNAALVKDVQVATQDYVVGNMRGGPDALRHRIFQSAQDEGVELDEDTIDIDDQTKYVRVTFDYQVVLRMPWGEWPQDFHIEEEIPRL